MHPLTRNDRGVEQLVARQAHNLEVARSNPASATKRKRNATQMWITFLFVLEISFTLSVASPSHNSAE